MEYLQPRYAARDRDFRDLGLHSLVEALSADRYITHDSRRGLYAGQIIPPDKRNGNDKEDKKDRPRERPKRIEVPPEVPDPEKLPPLPPVRHPPQPGLYH